MRGKVAIGSDCVTGKCEAMGQWFHTYPPTTQHRRWRAINRWICLVNAIEYQ